MESERESGKSLFWHNKAVGHYHDTHTCEDAAHLRMLDLRPSSGNEDYGPHYCKACFSRGPQDANGKAITLLAN